MKRQINKNLPDLNSKTNYLVFTKKEIPGLNNQIVFNDFPIPIFKLLEKINIEFIKKKFHEQSDITIGNYNFNLNSRVMSFGENKLKLTEKEINSILYLFKIAEKKSRYKNYKLKFGDINLN